MKLLPAGLLTLVLAAPASAADITVTTRLDVVAADGRCSLREAVSAANTGTAFGGCAAGSVAMDVIRLGDGHYPLSRAGAREDGNATGDLDLVGAGPLTLQGVGRDRTVVSAEGLDRVIDVLAGAGVTVADLAITGGAAPDGADGTFGMNPGGAGEPGGGIRSAGRLELRDSAVRGNRAGRGGAGGNGDNTTPGGPGGSAGEGGGIYSSSTLTLIRTRVVDNRAGASGSSGRAFVGANAVQPGGNGGGIAASGLTTVADSVVESNRAGAGGDGGGGGGTVIGGHAADGGRGGGFIVTAPASITRSTIAGNSSGAGGRGGDAIQTGGDGGDGGEGGGVYATGSLTVTGTLFAGNTTGDGGGGGNATVVTAGKGGSGGSGAGLVGFTGADVDVESSTFVGGTVGAGGPRGTPSGIDGFVGTATAVRAVGAVALARTIAAGSCDGTVDDGGGNLGTEPTCPVTIADPLLNASGMPGAGSPAIDAATSCPAADLAGTARPQGAACDIGALEAPAAATAVTRTGLDFGSVTVGGAATRSVDVSNPGLPGLPLAIGVAGDPVFTLIGHTCGTVLAGGAGCAVTVRFAPAATGSRAATLGIGGDTLALAGTGVAAPGDPPPPQATARCVVPRLKGKTVAGARRALRQANCKLGKVTRRGRGRPGRVRAFSPKAGTQRPAGATVRVVVNRARARPRR